MGKYYENASSFNYTWDQLVTGFWKRYPNPYSTHVLSEDTICREFRGDTLYTKRVLTKTNRMPKWGTGIVSSTIVAIVEESEVDAKGKTLVTYTRNVGYSRIMSITEKVIYSPDPENSGQTLATRKAWIDSQLYGFRRAIETFGLERFKTNCSKAVLGFNHILQILYPRPHFLLTANSDNKSVSRLDETKEKLREKAKKAGEIARKSAGKIALVSTAKANVDA